MEYYEKLLLPPFDNSWIAECESAAALPEGVPPNIACPVTYCAYPDVLDEQSLAAMSLYLESRRCDLVSRFAVLRYLWAASQASFPNYMKQTSDDECDEDSEEKAMRSAANKHLTTFLEKLAPEDIATPEHAMWEFKQSFMFLRFDRLKRLGHCRAMLVGRSSEEAALLLGRALWLPNSEQNEALILQFLSGLEVGEWSWERFLGGALRDVSRLATLTLLWQHEAAISPDLAFDAIDSLTRIAKTKPEIMGPHWGVLADCQAMVGDAGACAQIWEEHGIEIVKAMAEEEGISPADMLNLPDFQFHVADLWAAAGCPAEEIETLERLKARSSNLQGVNRRLVDLYTKSGDDDAATLCAVAEARCDKIFSEDPIVRLLLKQCGKTEEAEQHLMAAREEYERRPENLLPRTVIRNTLALTWPPFLSLSAKGQEDWVVALHWCCADGIAFSESERTSLSVLCCARAFENHLRETIFEPLRDATSDAEAKQLPDTFERLRSFLDKSRSECHLELGPMLHAIARSHLPTILWDFLSKRCSRPKGLCDEKFREIGQIRNPNVHQAAPCLEDARRCIKLCAEFLSILEAAPPPRPLATHY